MAKITGPLLSFGARGSIGKTIVAASWKGRNYMRQHVVPSNPNTTAQQNQRALFRWLNAVYKTAPSLVTAAWDAYASGQVMTGRNGFVKINGPLLFGQTDLQLLTFSGGAKGGLPAAGMTATGGALQITVALTAPALPDGWTIAQAEAAVIADQDPFTENLYTISSGFDISDPYSIVITGLTAATPYQVCGWFKYNKPDGSIAYGPASLDQASTS